jgi:hypothetical protein
LTKKGMKAWAVRPFFVLFLHFYRCCLFQRWVHLTDAPFWPPIGLPLLDCLRRPCYSCPASLAISSLFLPTFYTSPLASVSSHLPLPYAGALSPQRPHHISILARNHARDSISTGKLCRNEASFLCETSPPLIRSAALTLSVLSVVAPASAWKRGRIKRGRGGTGGKARFFCPDWIRQLSPTSSSSPILSSRPYELLQRGCCG